MAYRFFPILTLGEVTPYFPADPDEPQTRSLAWRAAWLALLAIVPFVPALRGGAIWLDEPLVFRNPLLKTAGGLGQIWFHPRSLAEYHPAAATAMWIEYHALGNHPFGYHVVSLALHAATVLMLWRVLRRLDVAGAWLAAAVFAVHPMAVQAVAWINRQDYVLGTALFMASLLSALRFFEVEPAAPEYYLERYPEPRRGAYVASLVFFAAAVLCLPGLAVGPVVLALLLWWKRGGLAREHWVHLAPMFVTAASVGGFVGWLWATGDTSSDVSMGLPRGATLAPMAIGFYALKVLVPYPTLFVYPRWSVMGWQGLCCAVALIATAGGIAWWARSGRGHGRGCVVALALFVGSLMPALGGWRGEGTTYAFVADFFAYPAMIGLIVPVVDALVFGVSRICGARYVSAARLGVGIVLLAGLIALSVVQSSNYGSEVRLWRATIARGGASPIAYERLGVALLDRGEVEDALRALRRGQAMEPSNARAATYLGLAYESLNRWGEAIAEYRRALEANPRNADVYVHLAGAYAAVANLEEAEANYRAALKLKPRDPVIHNSLGLILVLRGRLGDGIDQYHEALEMNPDLISARLNLADAEYRRGNFEVAAKELQGIIDMDPQHPNFEALMNAGFILHQHREYGKAERMFKVAVEVNHRSPEAHNALGMVQAAQGRLEEAILSFEQALDLKPDFVEARRNLEAARRQRGR